MQVVSKSDIDRMAVIGAGTMGRGIAATKALAGYETTVQDIDGEQLENAMEDIAWSYEKLLERDAATEDETDAALERLCTTRSIEDAVANADFVTEAAPERLSVKRSIFEDLTEHAPQRAIFATNTSGLSVSALAEITHSPGRVIGTHWFNPPVLMDLVEIVETEDTDPAAVETCEALAREYGKTTIRCRRDVPLFIVNRCFRPYEEAAAWLVHLGEATVEEIDSAMRHREGFPMGPFELADYLGSIQIRVEQEQDLLEDGRPLSYDTRVCPLIHEKYDQGHYGRKAGRGFYEYDDGEAPDIPRAAGEGFDTRLLWGPIINEAAKMVQHDVATPRDVDTGLKLGGNWPVGPLEKADDIGADAVVRACTEFAAIHDRLPNLVETLPCDLLVEKAQAGESFH